MIWHSTDREQFIKYIGTDIETGLNNTQVKQRLESDGENIPTYESFSFLGILAEQFKKLPLIFLFVAVLLYTIVGINAGVFRIAEPIFIIILAAARALIDTIIIYNSKASIAKLGKMSSPACKVLRNGNITQISAASLVVGDVIVVGTGDFIPADARLIETINLHCDESALTGDTVPCQKDATTPIDEIAPLSERANMIYSGSFVTSGQAIAIVTETGNFTEIVKSNTLNYKNDSIDPLKDKLTFFHTRFQTAVLAVCAVIYILSILLKLHATEITFTALITQRLMETAAIAATVIPDCLLALVSVSLAFGVQRILKKNALLKNTQTLNELSQIDIICSDKTGTLTTSNMTVTEIYNGEGFVTLDNNLSSIDVQTANTLRLSALCTDAQPELTDPTQTAIIEACERFAKLQKNDLEALYPRIAEIPFDATRKLMTTVNMIDGTNYSVVKGAPEALIPLCVNCNSEDINKAVEKMSADALRVIAVAIKPLDEAPSNPTSELLENGLTFIGLLGIADRIRLDVQASIALCKKSGIKTVMMTGDNIVTASAIAQKLGILTADTVAVTSEQISSMTDTQLTENIEKISVFAAMSPDDKLRLIDIYKALGKTVAVTGDLVDDAHALQKANVGFAMGIKGTDVAKGAADVIITDDSFATIPEATKQVRSIYRNLRNTVRYLLTCNISKLIFCLIGTAIFAAVPFTALQLVWLFVLCGLTPTLSLCTDEPTDKILLTPAKNNTHTLFDRSFTLNIAWQSVVIAAVSLVSMAIGGASAAFITMSVAHVLQVLVVRTRRSLFSASYKSAKYIGAAIIVSLLFAILTVCTSFGALFGFAKLDAQTLLIALLLSIIPAVLSEAVKLYKSIKK